MTPLLELKDIRRSYPAGDEQVEVLKGIGLDIYAGEMVAIVGASGSGKSTLIDISSAVWIRPGPAAPLASPVRMLPRWTPMRWRNCAASIWL
ncbi:ATP-binding cassette domain-containing protein [Shigella flexneri]